MAAIAPRPRRPLAPEFDQIPAELKACSRWLCWRHSEHSNAAGKYGKVPHNIADKKANYTDSAEWLAFDTVVRQYHRGNYDGMELFLVVACVAWTKTTASIKAALAMRRFVTSVCWTATRSSRYQETGPIPKRVKE